jgi:hypothetical protein
MSGTSSVPGKAFLRTCGRGGRGSGFAAIQHAILCSQAAGCHGIWQGARAWRPRGAAQVPPACLLSPGVALALQDDFVASLR